MQLKPMSEFTSCCAGPKAGPVAAGVEKQKGIRPVEVAAFAAVLAAWWLVYSMLPAVSAYLTYDLLGLSRGSHLGEAVAFFIYDTPKVLMLLTLVVFGVGIVRSFFTPDRTRLPSSACRTASVIFSLLLVEAKPSASFAVTLNPKPCLISSRAKSTSDIWVSMLIYRPCAPKASAAFAPINMACLTASAHVSPVSCTVPVLTGHPPPVLSSPAGAVTRRQRQCPAPASRIVPN